MPCPVTAAHSASVSGRTDSRETNCQIFTIWSRAGCKSRKNDPNCSTKCSAVTTLLTNQLNSPFFFRSSAPFWKADVPRLFFLWSQLTCSCGWDESRSDTFVAFFFLEQLLVGQKKPHQGSARACVTLGLLHSTGFGSTCPTDARKSIRPLNCPRAAGGHWLAECSIDSIDPTIFGVKWRPAEEMPWICNDTLLSSRDQLAALPLCCV